MCNGPAEPSLFAYRLTCFRSYSRLRWDLLSVLELRGCAGCRACAHLLGKRNGNHSELRWGNAVRVKSYFVHLRWRDDFRKRRGDEGRREPKSASSGMKNAPPLNHAARFGRRGAGWRVHPAVVGRHDHEDRVGPIREQDDGSEEPAPFEGAEKGDDSEKPADDREARLPR